MDRTPSPLPTPHDRAGFFTTRWSRVLAAGSPAVPGSREALDELVRGYWYPLYAYLRRKGCDGEEARDLTQGYFARLLEREDLSQVDPSRGRFRAYLLAGIKNFLAGERERWRAAKRGGGASALSLDDAEVRYGMEPAEEDTPEAAFERSWANTVLQRALERLGASYEARGKRDLFDKLRAYLVPQDGGTPYAEIAVELGHTEGAIKVAVHRLRQRYGRSLREEILDTVEDPAAVDDEVRHLFAALGRVSGR